MQHIAEGENRLVKKILIGRLCGLLERRAETLAGCDHNHYLPVGMDVSRTDDGFVSTFPRYADLAHHLSQMNMEVIEDIVLPSGNRMVSFTESRFPMEDKKYFSPLTNNQLSIIATWLKQYGFINPLIIHGGPASGRTVLATALARCISGKPLTGLFNEKFDPLWLVTRKGGFDVAIIDAMRLRPDQTKAVWMNAVGGADWVINGDNGSSIIRINDAMPIILTPYTAGGLGSSSCIMAENTMAMGSVGHLKPTELKCNPPAFPVEFDSAVTTMMSHLDIELRFEIQQFKDWCGIE